MSDVVDRFYARTNGQRINSCGGIFGECVAGVQNYTNTELGIGGCPAFPVPAARLMYGTRTDAFNWVANTPSGIPPRGSIVVFDGNTGGGYGHTGVVVGANLNTLDVYQQNDPRGSGMYVKTYNYKNVIGWAIPKNGSINPPAKGVIMDINDGKALYQTGLHRTAESDGAASQWNGLKPDEAMKRLRSSAEWLAYDSKIKTYDNLQKQVSELSSRPTKAELEAIANQLKTANDKIVKLEEQAEIDKQKQSEDSKLLDEGKGVFSWLKRLFDRIK